MTDQTNSEEGVFEQLKEKYNKIKPIIVNLETYLQKFEVIKSKLEDENNGLEASLNWSQIKKQEMESVYNEMTEKISTLSVKSSEVNNLLVQSQEISKSIDEAKQSVDDNVEDIGINLNVATKNEEQTNILLKTAQEHNKTIELKLQEIISMLNEASSKIGEIKLFYEDFKKIQENIEDEETGVQSVIDYIENNKNQSDELIKQIEEIRSKSDKEMGLIEQNKKQSEDLKENIAVLLEKSEIDKKEISKYLKVVIDSAFANSFDERKKELSQNANMWQKIFIRSIVALLLLLIFLFWNYIFKDQSVPEWNVVLYRMAFSTPLLFLIAFSGKEYSNSKKHEEKYAFKSAISQAFPSHMQQLIDNFSTIEKGNEVILDIVKNTYILIYNTPYREECISDIEAKLLEKAKHDALIDKNENKSQKTNIVDTIKQLKDIFSDDKELFREVIGILKPIKN